MIYPGRCDEMDAWYLSTGNIHVAECRLEYMGYLVISSQRRAYLYGQRICKYILYLSLVSGSMGLKGRTRPNF